jgi:hypothetical protein
LKEVERTLVDGHVAGRPNGAAVSFLPTSSCSGLAHSTAEVVATDREELRASCYKLLALRASEQSSDGSACANAQQLEAAAAVGEREGAAAAADEELLATVAVEEELILVY